MHCRLATIVLAAAVGGCASVGDPIDFGDGQYKINSEYSWSRGGSEEALKGAIKKAQDFCEKKGKTASITGSGEGGYGTAAIKFRCH